MTLTIATVLSQRSTTIQTILLLTDSTSGRLTSRSMDLTLQIAQTTNMNINICVPGKPCQEGNMAAVKGHVFHANNTQLKTYRSLVGSAVFGEMKRHDLTITDKSVSVMVTFHFLHPKSHFTTKGNRSASYRHRYTKKPDIDKLTRSVLDALTGIVYRDDSQVDYVLAQKKYGLEPHTDIQITFSTEELP